MFARIVPDVAVKYGLAVARVGGVQKGYRNESYPLTLANGVTVNLIFYKREPSILRRITTADRVAAHAAQAGLPVRTRYDSRLLKIGNGYAGVYKYLPGQTISWEAYTKRHIKLVGWAMADLHQSLQDLPSDGSLLANELHELIGRMQQYFTAPNVRAAMAYKLGVTLDPQMFDGFLQLVEHSRKLAGRQYLHMDMVRGNVLFAEALPDMRWHIDDVSISGLIDFEKAAIGLPVCDVARTLAFLLVDCPKPADKIYKYFIDSGYRKRGGQGIAHVELLSHFIRLFLVHDLYKFLRHTPYESLRDNYHYSRTCQLLKDYGMISSKI